MTRFAGSNALVRLVDGMKVRGHDCTVMSYAGGLEVKEEVYLAFPVSWEDEERDHRYAETNGANLPWIHKPSGAVLVDKVKEFKPDVINLHWTHGPRFIPLDCLPELSRIAPLFWTLHDMWPLTGNCFYSYGCYGFKKDCDACEGELTDVDIAFPGVRRYVSKAKKLWKAKKTIYSELKETHFVAPSAWMKKMLDKSPFFKEKEVTIIPYGVPTDIFSPGDSSGLRSSLKLSKDTFVILLSAVSLKDPRKGTDLFVKAVNLIPRDKVVIIALGLDSEDLHSQISFSCITPGLVKSYTQMADFYNVADLYVLPTRADNLPSTILESMACGLPVVSFNVGGIPEMVNSRSGYLAQRQSVEDLAEGIINFYEKGEDELSLIAKQNRSIVIERFSIERQAEAYERLFIHAISK